MLNNFLGFQGGCLFKGGLLVKYIRYPKFMYFLEGRGAIDTRKYLQSPQAFHHVLIKHRRE